MKGKTFNQHYNIVLHADIFCVSVQYATFDSEVMTLYYICLANNISTWNLVIQTATTDFYDDETCGPFV